MVPGLCSLLLLQTKNERRVSVTQSAFAQGIDMRSDTPVEGGHADTERLGPRRDRMRDDDILDATLDVLAEVGDGGMTMGTWLRRALAKTMPPMSPKSSSRSSDASSTI
jgi:hypothetical protein